MEGTIWNFRKNSTISDPRIHFPITLLSCDNFPSISIGGSNVSGLANRVEAKLSMIGQFFSGHPLFSFFLQAILGCGPLSRRDAFPSREHESSPCPRPSPLRGIQEKSFSEKSNLHRGQ